MALCAACYCPLQFLEVALRNALHSALTQHHGGNERWYQLPQAFQHPKTVAKVHKAESDVSKVTLLTAPDAPGRVVAELDFGFWTTLLNRPYARPPVVRMQWVPLWPALIPVVFPYFPNPTGTAADRDAIGQRFDDVRNFRNRVSHHEPIWKGRFNARGLPRVPVQRQYEEILEAMGWINPALLHAVKALETWPQIHASGLAPYRAKLASLP